MKINAGCGDKKLIGYVNVDANRDFKPDVCHDLRKVPWPFRSNSADFVLMENVLEHMPDTNKILAEIHRILKPGGKVRIVVPHFLHQGAWRDPDHKKAFAPDSFKYYCASHPHFSKYNPFKFRLIKNRVHGMHYGSINFLGWMPNRVLRTLGNFIPGIVEDIEVELLKVQKS